ncbi:MAG: type VI secretion system tip protein VgrG [Myxococcales bacterium]|nr:type VI secretion system tip protein VgrG [Myxococcales bacterium]
MDQCILTCEALGAATVTRLAGREALSELSSFEVDVLSPDGAVDLEALLGSEAGLVLSDGEAARPVPLVVARASWAGVARDGHRYRLGLAPKAHTLAIRHGHEIFQNKTTQQIVADILTRAGLGGAELAFRLAGQYQERLYCVRYGESEWSFVLRLLAEEGINLWFDATGEGAPLTVCGDHDGAHGSIEGGPNLVFEDGSGMVRSAAMPFELERTWSLAHDKVHVRDFDVRRPDVLVEGVAGDGPLEHFEFPARTMNADAAQARAKARLEQLRRGADALTLRSHCARLQPGRVVHLDGASDEHHRGDFLIVAVEHTVEQAARSRTGGIPYANRASLVPYEQGRTYRPALPRAVPKVDTLETVVVTGPAGEEIHVDELGRIKARFLWDRSGKGDDTSSTWLRTLQLNMFSSMILPRVGWEVPVLYLHGDPDQPVVLGRVYGGSAAVPYGQPGKKATATVQSATSPGGGTTNEVRLADDAGKMEAFIHATKDQTVSVGGTQKTSVSVDKTRDITKSYEVFVKGPQSVSVSANQTVAVGADMSVTVKGAREVSVGGMEHVKVTGTLLVEVKGSCSELVGGAYALECNQSNTVVQGAFTQTVGGALATVAGLGCNRSFAAATAIEVGAVRSITAATRCVDSVKGTKKITSGASKDKAGGKIVTKVKGAGSVKVGGSAKVKAGGKIAISASKITIKAGGGIVCDGGGKLTLKGSVKPKGSKLKLDASDTEKKSTSKVGN